MNFKEEFLKTEIKLPEIGNYGVGMIFLPPEKNRVALQSNQLKKQLKKKVNI